MKAIHLIFCLILSGSVFTASAQSYFYGRQYYDNDYLVEAGIGINAMNCLTDLGGGKGLGGKFKDLNLKQTHMAFDVYGQFTYRYSIGLRLQGTYGTVSGQDEELKGINDLAKNRYNRNLNFRSVIMEASALAIVHPLEIIRYRNDQTPPLFSPYLMAGIGYFHFDPEGKRNNGTYIQLRPLSTEGQGFAEYPDRKPYALNQLNIPFGFGIKYELGALVNVRFEALYRALNTDYLDDVSKRYIDPALFSKYFSGPQLAAALEMNDRQINPDTPPNGDGIRGNPKQKDSYFTVGLKVAFVIGRDRRY